jgi:hypothetical protein
MTAIAAVKRADGLYLMADGAHYSGTGKLLKVSPKIILFPQASAALAGRGASMVLQGLLSLQLENIESFDQLLEFLPMGLKVATKMAGPIATLGMGGSRSEIVVAGWSKERDRPEIWVMGNQPMKTRGPDNTIIDTPAYEAIEWETPYLGQMPEEELCKEFAFGLPEDPANFDPTMHGFNWFQAMRRSTAKPKNEVEEAYFGGAKGLHLCGGFLQLATVYKIGVDSRILHHWPDKVGEKINPR